jgi:hypothetical protein
LTFASNGVCATLRDGATLSLRSAASQEHVVTMPLNAKCSALYWGFRRASKHNVWSAATKATRHHCRRPPRRHEGGISMDLEQTIDLAKRGKFSRAQLYGELEKRSRDLISPKVSKEQAFARFCFGEGKPLYDVYRVTEGKDFEPAPVTATVEKKAVDDWDGLVRAMQKVENCSYSRAVDLCMASEGGMYALNKRLRSDRISTGQFTVGDLACLDAATAEQDAWRDFHKRQPTASDVHAPGSSGHEYEHELARLRRLYPTEKESKLHDFIRTRQPDLWKDYVRKLGGGRRLPQRTPGEYTQAGDESVEAPTSGPAKPPRSPQWRSEHASNTPTTPDRESGLEPKDETPTVKGAVRAWNGLVDDVASRFGWGRERTVAVLKRIPAGRRLLDMAVDQRTAEKH